MEKNRGSQVIAIIALMVAVLGLSIGFSAFSNTLKISTNAEVKPASDFNVDFQKPDGSVTDLAGVASGEEGVTAGTATFNNGTDNPTIGGLQANFTQPGQTVKYTFRVANVGKLQAYFKSITFANAANSATYKKCTANATSSTGNDGVATQSLVDAACNGISMTVKVDQTTYNGSDAAISDSVGLNPVDASGNVVAGGYKEVEVTITYASDAARADGDFTVTFGDVSLVYSTVASSS